MIPRYIYSLILLSAMGCLPATGQQSAFQSGNGQTSIYLGSGGSAATFNSSDTKVSISYLNRHSEKWRLFGYEAYAKASSGVATLFSSKIKVPEGGADFVFGGHPTGSGAPTSGKDRPPRGADADSAKDQWALIDVGYSRSAFYVSDVAQLPDKAKRYFDRFRAVAVWNRKFSDHFLFGIASGAERRNNLDDLTQITFQTTVLPPPSGATTSVVKTQSGFLGSYREYIAAPLYTDMLVVLPAKVTLPGFGYHIALDGFTRSDLAATRRSADGGLGVFLTKKGAVTRVVGGLAASWNAGKVRVAFIASYNF